MRRILVAAALAALSTFPSPAQADVCAGTVLCAVDGCRGTVNVCPTAQTCSGGVSVCPMADARDCHSSVDVCGILHVNCHPACPPAR
ncbi:MAG TPA: hypothetical protein VNA20_01170 [Frankiaceae bacterium]|nr:hypothetical protein [Frankiaceae bacterium]